MPFKRRRNPTPPAEESGSVNTPQNSPVQSPPRPERKIAELFLRQNPPIFTGAGSPADAEEWVRAIEKIFKFLECTDKECLLCISFLLKGPTDFWWESRQKTLTPEQRESFTWEKFKEELDAKFVPRSYRKQRLIEFMSFKQGKRSVAEYDREFCNWTRYAPYKIETDEKMAELFRSGLRQEIRVVLAAQPPMSYTETLNRALDMEMEMQLEKPISDHNPASLQIQDLSEPLPSEQKFGKKRKWDNKQFSNKKQFQILGQSNQEPFRSTSQGQSQSFRNQHRTSASPRYDRVHSGVCRWGSNSCYTCGQVGHYANNCPNRPRSSDSGGRSNPSRSTQPMKAITGYPQPPQQFHSPLVFQIQSAPSPQPQFQTPQPQSQTFPHQSQHQRAFALA